MLKDLISNPLTWFFVVTCILVVADMIYGAYKCKQLMRYRGCMCDNSEIEMRLDNVECMVVGEKRKRGRPRKKR